MEKQSEVRSPKPRHQEVWLHVALKPAGAPWRLWTCPLNFCPHLHVVFTLCVSESSSLVCLLSHSLKGYLSLDLGPAQVILEIWSQDSCLHLQRHFFQIGLHSHVPGLGRGCICSACDLCPPGTPWSCPRPWAQCARCRLLGPEPVPLSLMLKSRLGINQQCKDLVSGASRVLGLAAFEPQSDHSPPQLCCPCLPVWPGSWEHALGLGGPRGSQAVSSPVSLQRH